MNEPFRIFIGYDERQAVAFTTLQQSIIESASAPVSITPLVLSTLPISRRGLTPFTYSRFLVPWLCDYQGHALFLDADMFFVSDVNELRAYFDENKAISVVRSVAKFEQSSVLLFNNSHPKNRILEPAFVEKTQENLLGLSWVDESEIGALGPQWNQLVGYQECSSAEGNLHFTMGVPAFPETSTSPFIELWTECAKRAIGVTESWSSIMGSSVHSVKIGSHLFPKYVCNENMTNIIEEHQGLIAALTENSS